LVSKDGDYVEKTGNAEVDSDKATLELPAEASGIITLKSCSSSRSSSLFN
jgi:2-oxoglutarate dehydrogenase E2 component (dihydrolipoamide succinyltransferase)